MAGQRDSTPSVNNAKNSEPNAQNSELDPNVHPSGSRIEKMAEDVNAAHAKDEPAEGGRDEFNDDSLEAPADDSSGSPSKGHRNTPETRADEG